MIKSLIQNSSTSKPLSDSVILSSSHIRHFDRWDFDDSSPSALRKGRPANDIFQRRLSARAPVKKREWTRHLFDFFLRT